MAEDTHSCAGLHAKVVEAAAVESDAETDVVTLTRVNEPAVEMHFWPFP
jgi:hypothetical protein